VETNQYDFIIVGAGSAGCVLAERLSKDGRYRILVLEAGGSDHKFWIKLPLGYGKTFYDDRVNWKFETEPDPGCNGRKSYWPRGKVLGGSSSINALVYCRGLPHDFDDWQEAGAAGWGWNDVHPHFEQLERRVSANGEVTGEGPLSVTDVSNQMHHCTENFLDAATVLGFARTRDFNGDHPEGVGSYHLTTRNGIRCSAADAFLRPAIRRENATVLTNAEVHRVIFDGTRAVGVEYVKEGQLITARAKKEIILCAGAVKSPQILQLSGVGPGEILQSHGIDVVCENKHVGGNLQDHLAINYSYRATQPTLNNQLSPWWGKVWAGLKYTSIRRGPLSLSVNQCGGFVRSSPDLDQPDMQLYFNPISYNTSSKRKVELHPFPGFLISFQPARPTSRGRIDICSPNPDVPPKIEPNYLSSQKDCDDVVRGGRLIQSFVQTESLRSLIAAPLPPDPLSYDDDSLLDDFRERAGTVFHPVSTCRMGENITSSVVNPSLTVHGTSALRVVDASAFPCITSGNTNAPTIMLAHKAADIILSAYN
jgi:choline dehydrogenase